MPEWSQISELLELKCRLLRDEWGVSFPPYGTEASAEDAAVCDDYCRLLAADFEQSVEPPDGAKPWMLARLLMASVLAGTLGQKGETLPLRFDSKLVEQLLVDEWHFRLRSWWRDIGQELVGLS